MDDLPGQLRAAIRDEAQGRALREATRTASDSYRQGKGTRITNDDEAIAYGVWRMPATYAATSSALRALAEALPDWEPRSLIDVGAGPGTAAWAAVTLFPSIEVVTSVETAAPMRALGQRLASAHHVLADGEWLESLPEHGADLVVCSYALGEIGPDVTKQLWRLAAGHLLIVEPGTPTGFASVLQARTQLIALGASIAAPCPAAHTCPMADGPAWCHFAVRLPRDPLHVKAKSASLPFEDEPYSYIAAGRVATLPISRLIGRPRFRKHLVRLPLCTANGLDEMVLGKRHPDYKTARKLEWGAAVGFDATRS